MPERVTDEDLELLGALGVDTARPATGGRTAREQRIIAGFEDILRFVEEHGRPPQHGEDRDIFERLYAVRLDRIRESNECREVLKDLDTRGLLGISPAPSLAANNEMGDDDLLAALGVEAAGGSDVTDLVHVRSRDDIRAAEEIARRTPCADFAQFKPIFQEVQRELEAGARHTIKFKQPTEFRQGDVFIIEGQKALIAELGEPFVAEFGRPDRRLRVIFDNGTEAQLLLRSLQRSLYKDKNSRRITEPGFGPLFSDIQEEEDLATGYIYVLRSKSDHPFVAEHRDVIHKIGVTGSDVNGRVANARKDPTYLLADVEIVATYKLANIDRKKLEGLLHKVFGSARLDLELKDRFGSQVEPREWFLVPLPVIDEAIQRIKDGSIASFRYDCEAARLTPT
jgi:hypothetical protein